MRDENNWKNIRGSDPSGQALLCAKWPKSAPPRAFASGAPPASRTAVARFIFLRGAPTMPQNVRGRKKISA
ncbi:UNVERIFIED_ORG: hypothetical protein M2348_000694 [Sphingomonas sp. R1F5B]